MISTPKIAIEMQLGFATLHVIARSISDEAISKKGLLRFARNDRETLLITDLGINLHLERTKL